MRAIASRPKEFRFTGAESIQVSRDMPEAEQRFEMIEDVLQLVSND